MREYAWGITRLWKIRYSFWVWAVKGANFLQPAAPANSRVNIFDDITWGKRATLAVLRLATSPSCPEVNLGMVYPLQKQQRRWVLGCLYWGQMRRRRTGYRKGSAKMIRSQQDRIGVASAFPGRTSFMMDLTSTVPRTQWWRQWPLNAPALSEGIAIKNHIYSGNSNTVPIWELIWGASITGWLAFRSWMPQYCRQCETTAYVRFVSRQIDIGGIEQYMASSLKLKSLRRPRVIWIGRSWQTSTAINKPRDPFPDISS